MGFLKGAAVGAVCGAAFVMWLFMIFGGNRHMNVVELGIFCCIAGGSLGAGIGGVVSSVRKATTSTVRLVRRRAGDGLDPTAIDPRPRLVISALYALTAASAGTLLCAGLFGRGEVTRLVGSLVPYEVSSLQARLMLSGTLFLGAYALIAGISLRAGKPGTREQSLIAGAGFLAGILGLPSLAVVLT